MSTFIYVKQERVTSEGQVISSVSHALVKKSDLQTYVTRVVDDSHTDDETQFLVGHRLDWDRFTFYASENFNPFDDSGNKKLTLKDLRRILEQ